MKIWIVCKYSATHIAAPHLCTPVGVATQITECDPPGTRGFLFIDKFEAWLKEKDLCAFGERYKKALGINDRANGLSVLYPVNEKGEQE